MDMKKARLVILIAALLVVLAVSLPAAAHEHRTVGSYSIELGWRNEPAYTGLLNGPEVFVHEAAPADATAEPGSDEGPEGAAVTGAEDTLKLEVSYGGKTKQLKLRAVYQDPGHYVADLIPTQPGDYSFHLTGTIGDTAIDETFTSADGQFGSVEPISDIQFP
jgi:hypothetical protein